MDFLECVRAASCRTEQLRHFDPDVKKCNTSQVFQGRFEVRLQRHCEDTDEPIFELVFEAAGSVFVGAASGVTCYA